MYALIGMFYKQMLKLLFSCSISEQGGALYLCVICIFSILFSVMSLRDRRRDVWRGWGQWATPRS